MKEQIRLFGMHPISGIQSGIHPISPKTKAPQYQPIDRKKRKGKKVEDNSRDRAA